jgi:hypothetical protein
MAAPVSNNGAVAFPLRRLDGATALRRPRFGAKGASGRRYWHWRDAVTTCAAVSDVHLTISVPLWFDALHVPVQVTVHVAPDPHVTLDPPPTVTVQSLPDSH